VEPSSCSRDDIMPNYLLIGAGFSRNWGGPLSEEITGSLLGELHDDAQLANALRQGPFEDAFQGFGPATGSPEAVARQQRFQNAVSGVFARLNKTFLAKQFEFSNDVEYSIKRFLTRFDAIFTLNQDLLLEIHYMQMFGAQPRWSGVLIPGMRAVLPAPGTGPFDFTMTRWRPTDDFAVHQSCQPFFKLHGSSNWETEAGERVLIMGGSKSGAIQRFPVLKHYHDRFAAYLGQGNARLMVVGYSFQDEHINSVIEAASRERGLGTYLIDPSGRNVLRDPKMERAAIRVPRDIEQIKLVGELRRPLSAVFAGDTFAHGELMRFFQT
jgi:SIR2-like protein